MSEVPRGSCSADAATQTDLNVGLGRFLGLSVGADGTVCVNVGAALAAPFEFTLGTGKPLWK